MGKPRSVSSLFSKTLSPCLQSKITKLVSKLLFSLLPKSEKWFWKPCTETSLLMDVWMKLDHPDKQTSAVGWCFCGFLRICEIVFFCFDGWQCSFFSPNNMWSASGFNSWTNLISYIQYASPQSHHTQTWCCFYCYADDTRVYLPVKPNNLSG